MNRKEQLLLKVMEECGETAQRASKAISFGIMEVQEGQILNNGQRLIQEFNDLQAIIEMLQEDELLPYQTMEEQRNAIQTKKEKVEKYLGYSKMLGTLRE